MSKKLRSGRNWQPDIEPDAAAREVLPAMARDYFQEGRKIVQHGADPDELHPFRLATKHFRYTLELFRDVYGPSLEEKLDLLKPVQSALGDVNDCVATADGFGENKEFRKYLKRRAGKKTRAFLDAWRDSFDAPGQEEAWVVYLASVTRPEPPAAQDELQVSQEGA